MADDENLARRLAQRAAEVDAKVAYCIRPLDGAEPIRLNAADSMHTASTFKLYALAALFAADAAGKLSLDERVEYSADHHTHGSGVLKLLAPGLRLTLRDHARLMIVISDNVSTNAVLRALGGPQAANAAVHALGVPLPATEIRGYVSFGDPSAFAVSSADDFTAMLAAIHARRCTGSPKHDEEIYWTLRRQQHRSGIARYLPCSEYAEEFGVEEYDRCGSKSGSMPGFRGDIGLIDTRKRSWAIAVMVQGEVDFDTGEYHPYNHLIADISRMVFETWGRA